MNKLDNYLSSELNNMNIIDTVCIFCNVTDQYIDIIKCDYCNKNICKKCIAIYNIKIEICNKCSSKICYSYGCPDEYHHKNKCKVCHV